MRTNIKGDYASEAEAYKVADDHGTYLRAMRQSGRRFLRE